MNKMRYLLRYLKLNGFRRVSKGIYCNTLRLRNLRYDVNVSVKELLCMDPKLCMYKIDMLLNEAQKQLNKEMIHRY